MAEQLSLNINFERQEVALNVFNLSKNMKVSNDNLNALNGLNEVDVIQFYEVQNGIILKISYKGVENHFRAITSKKLIQDIVDAGADDWSIYRNGIINLALSVVSADVNKWKNEINNKS